VKREAYVFHLAEGNTYIMSAVCSTLAVNKTKLSLLFNWSLVPSEVFSVFTKNEIISTLQPKDMYRIWTKKCTYKPTEVENTP